MVFLCRTNTPPFTHDYKQVIKTGCVRMHWSGLALVIHERAEAGTPLFFFSVFSCQWSDTNDATEFSTHDVSRFPSRRTSSVVTIARENKVFEFELKLVPLGMSMADLVHEQVWLESSCLQANSTEGIPPLRTSALQMYTEALDIHLKKQMKTGIPTLQA